MSSSSEPPPPPPGGAAAVKSHRPNTAATTTTTSQTDSWASLFPLHAACQTGLLEQAKMLLESMSGFGALSVDSADDDGWTPLHYAAWYGHVSVVRYLLEAGASVDSRSPTNTTALHLASGCGHVPVVEALLKAGARTDLHNNEKQTASALCAQLRPEQHDLIEQLLSSSS